MPEVASQPEPDGAEIVVVDNGSTDDSVSYVRHQFPSVRVIETGRNLGYAGGMNVGIENTARDFVVLLNNDIIADRTWLAELLSGIASDDRIGIAGCKVLFDDGETLQHAGGRLSMPMGMPTHLGYGEPDTGEYDTLRDAEYVTGAAMAVRREAAEQLGGLDAGFYPIYFEDADVCLRARAIGWRVVYVPTSRLVHLESATMVRDSLAYLLRFHQGRLRFVLKHVPPEEVLSGFAPAESEWQERIGKRELEALRRAYKTALRMLAELYGKRYGYDEQGFDLVQQVAEALVKLHAQATERTTQL